MTTTILTIICPILFFVFANKMIKDTKKIHSYAISGDNRMAVLTFYSALMWCMLSSISACIFIAILIKQ